MVRKIIMQSCFCLSDYSGLGYGYIGLLCSLASGTLTSRLWYIRFLGSQMPVASVPDTTFPM